MAGNQSKAGEFVENGIIKPQAVSHKLIACI